jgi:guanylate kinase
MLSDQTTQKLNRLFKTQENYRPNPDIAAKLATKTIVMLVGATCEGKNLVMSTATQLDKNFHVSGTRTSREPREGDDTGRYTYYQNSDEGLRSVLESIEHHEMVQYAINPYAQLIYGSTIDDYPSEYSLADVFSSAIGNFRQLGFKQAIAITVISDPVVWLERFEKRFPRGHAERQARRDEAIESFTWSLSQNKDHFWVENVNGQPELGAQQIIGIALGTSPGQPHVRYMATASLEAAWSIAV